MKRRNGAFWRYSSLGVLGMLGSAGTILADAVFVSDKLGAEGLAAMNLAMCVFGLMNGAGLSFGVGGATRYTILRTRGQDREAAGAFSLALGCALAAGTACALVGLLFSRQLSVWLGANEDTFVFCNTYLRTILCLAPAFILNHLLMAFVRNDGNPGLAMRAMTLGSLTNIVLDYLFLYPLEMGIFGAAIATGIAALLSIGLCSLHILSDRCHLRLVRQRPSARRLAQVAAGGWSTFITELSSGVVLVVFNRLILDAAGTVGVAAYGVVANLALMVLAVMNGIAHGVQPLISRAHGRGDGRTAACLYAKGTRLTLAIGAGVFAGAFWFAPALAGWFNAAGDPQLQSLAENGLRLYFTGFFFVGCNYLTAAYCSAAEQPRRAFLVALFRGCVGITVVACLLAALFGMTGIWLAFPAEECITLLLCRLPRKKTIAARAVFASEKSLF